MRSSTDPDMSYASPPPFPRRAPTGGSILQTLTAIVPAILVIFVLPLILLMWLYTRGGFLPVARLDRAAQPRPIA